MIISGLITQTNKQTNKQNNNNNNNNHHHHHTPSTPLFSLNDPECGDDERGLPADGHEHSLDDDPQLLPQIFGQLLDIREVALQHLRKRTSGTSLTDTFKVKDKVTVIETNMSTLCHA